MARFTNRGSLLVVGNYPMSEMALLEPQRNCCVVQGSDRPFYKRIYHNEDPPADKSHTAFLINGLCCTTGLHRRNFQPNCIETVLGNLGRSSSWGLAMAG